MVNLINLAINVFGNSSSVSESKIDSSLFVQKPYLRTNYIESNVEEDIGFKNQRRSKYLPDPMNVREACSTNYVDILFEKDFGFIDFKFRNLKFVEVNYQTAVNEHLTAKIYVVNKINELSSVENN